MKKYNLILIDYIISQLHLKMLLINMIHLNNLNKIFMMKILKWFLNINKIKYLILLSKKRKK